VLLSKNDIILIATKKQRCDRQMTWPLDSFEKKENNV